MSRRLIPVSGAGVQPDYIFPDSEKNQGILTYITAILTTDATAANRDVIMRLFGKSGNLVGNFPSSVTQIASQGFSYTWGGTGTAYDGSFSGNIQIPMSDIFAEGGDRILLATLGIQAGDLWSNWLITIFGAPGEKIGP